MSVSLTMIVRDEERSLGRALASARPLVDEMVVVDTGSHDGTAAIARSHGARVLAFAWCDDFAAARNHALAAATGDHALVLDADEWVETDDPDVLRRWATAHPGAAGEVVVSSTMVSDGSEVTTDVVSVRLLPRGTTYRGRIHEQPVGHATSCAVPGVLLRHDGYEAPQIARKQGRNARLLTALLAECPHDAYLTFQLGRERQIEGSFAAAADLYLEALNAAHGAPSWLSELRARALCTLQRAGRTDEAVRLAGALLREEPSAEVLFAAGNLFLDAAVERPAHAAPFVALAKSSWTAALEVGESPGAHDGTRGCGSFLAAENLAGLAEAEGDEGTRRDWAERAHVMRATSGLSRV